MVNCCHTLSCYLSGSTDHFACCTPRYVTCFFKNKFYPGQCEHATRRITTQFARNQFDLFCTKFYLNGNVFTVREHAESVFPLILPPSPPPPSSSSSSLIIRYTYTHANRLFNIDVCMSDTHFIVNSFDGKYMQEKIEIELRQTKR